MIQVYKIDLPPPSPGLVTSIHNFVSTLVLDARKKQWLDDFHNQTVNSALHYFDRSLLEEQTQQEYGKFFNVPITGLIGVMKNTQLLPACMPPHVDRKRGVALNYYLETGGNNVDTVFYDAIKDTDIDGAVNYHYDSVSKFGQYRFQKNQWYAYEVSRCHSVENIETSRIIFAIVSDYTDTVNSIENFKNAHPLIDFELLNDLEQK